MRFELTGKLILKSDTVQRTETFKTREFVVEVSEEANGKTFVNYIKFQCVQEKTAMLDRINTGDDVKVYFNIRGTKWEKDGKTNYITNLDAWKVEQLVKPGSGDELPHETSFTASEPADIDDLPF